MITRKIRKCSISGNCLESKGNWKKVKNCFLVKHHMVFVKELKNREMTMAPSQGTLDNTTHVSNSQVAVESFGLSKASQTQTDVTQVLKAASVSSASQEGSPEFDRSWATKRDQRKCVEVPAILDDQNQ